MIEQKWKDDLYQKWNMTVEEANKQTQAIRVPGMRLTMEEKHSLFYHKMELGADIENKIVAQGIVLWERELAEEIQEWDKQDAEFEKELTRLSGEDQTGYVKDAPMEEYELLREGIEYCGAKDYADYWFRTRF